MHTQLFSDNMESWNSQNANNGLEVISCHEIQNLNHGDNQVTCQTNVSQANTWICIY